MIMIFFNCLKITQCDGYSSDVYVDFPMYVYIITSLKNKTRYKCSKITKLDRQLVDL